MGMITEDRKPIDENKTVEAIIERKMRLVGLSATADASDIWQLPYSYKYEIVKDAGESAFVICDDCPERKRLPLSFRQRILSSLAVRTSEAILEKPALANQIRETKGVDSPTHELSCLFTTIHFGFESHEILPEEKNKLLKPKSSV